MKELEHRRGAPSLSLGFGVLFLLQMMIAVLVGREERDDSLSVLIWWMITVTMQETTEKDLNAPTAQRQGPRG